MWNVDKTSFEIYLINSFLIFNYCVQFQVLHLTFTYVYREGGGGSVIQFVKSEC